MDVNSFIQAISTLGFPICMCAALFWYMIKQNEQHEQESKEMRDAINKLEIAITRLTDKIGGENNEV